MADSAIEVFALAEQQLGAAKYAEALQSYLRVVRAVPQFWRARLRIADTLLNLKARPEALEVYKALAWQAVKGGQPLSGLVAIKMAAAIDPNERAAVETVAQLYCHTSDRVDPTLEAPPRRQLKKDDKAGDPVTLQGPALIAAAGGTAADTSNMGPSPDKLPGIPLFSFLDEDAFVAVLSSLHLRRCVKGNKIIEEGQPGDSFFLLAEGNVEVSRTSGGRHLQLARLGAGSVFGEMALISNAPRTATVGASDDCDLLELKRASLEQQAGKLHSVTAALKNFTQERFLTNLTATSPVFKPFPRSIRVEIVKKFRDFPIDAGDELISEGEMAQGLFFILKGNVEVTKKDPSGERVRLATLKEGDVFGEIALLEDTPTTATVTATMPGELLFLPKKEFTSAMARHPELKDELRKLTAERIAKNKTLLDTESLEILLDDDLIML